MSLFTDELVQEYTLQGTEGSQVEHWRTRVGLPGAAGTGSQHGGSHPPREHPGLLCNSPVVHYQ